MAVTYMAALERLGRKAQLTLDKKRGTELIRRENGDLVVRHHGDHVVTIHRGDEYTIRTGFQASATKRRRIAEYSPISVIVKKGGLWAVRASGEVMPFLEGMRVDIQGRPVDAASIAAGYGEPAAVAAAVGQPGTNGGAYGSKAGTGRPPAPVPAEDVKRLRMFIRREVRDYMHELGVSAAQAVTGTPTRVMSLRAGVRQATGGQDVIPSLLPLIERMLIAQKIPPQTARRVITDMHGSFYQGRKAAGEAPPLDLPPVQETEKPPTGEAREALERQAGEVLCPKCKSPVIAHYTMANQKKDCDYAMKHSSDLRILD